MNHHISGALAHERIAEAVHQAQTAKRSRLGSRRAHGSVEIPPFALPVVHEIVHDSEHRRPRFDSELW